MGTCELGGGFMGLNGLAWSLIVGNIILPMLTIPLTWFFIPNVRLDEEFIDEKREVELADGVSVATSAIAEPLEPERAEQRPEERADSKIPSEQLSLINSSHSLHDSCVGGYGYGRGYGYTLHAR